MNSSSTPVYNMPTINRIHIDLLCLQNLSHGGPIEEFAPRKPLATDPDDLFMPELWNSKTKTVSVFIPIFPRAQFTVRYRAPELPCPPPPGWFDHTSHKPDPPHPPHPPFYVFKLFVANDEITTWSCGVENAWKGNVAFGLFDTSSQEVSRDGKGLRKRLLAFNGDIRMLGDMTCDKDPDRKLEIRVYRASNSLRAPRQPPSYEGQGLSMDIR
jgi:hypothetical protein